MKKEEKKMYKEARKKNLEELQQYLHFKKRGFVIENKKGKGSYRRNKKVGDDE